MGKPKARFKVGVAEWTAVGNATTFGWESTGGNPAGHLVWTGPGTGDTVYYRSNHASFGGDFSDYFRGKLTYDVFASEADLDGQPDAKIVGRNGVTLVAVVGQAGTDWTHEAIGLREGQGWHIGTLTGALATADDIKGVLASVVEFQIRAQYGSGDQDGGLDNVVLKPKVPLHVPTDAFGADHHVHDGAMLGLGAHHALATDGLALA